jgi:nucleotide-binding universal stress UspA family protein
LYKKIMVPLDGSELAECVLPHLDVVARAPGVETVVFVSVSEPFEDTLKGHAEYSLGEDRIKELDARGKKLIQSYLDNLVSRLDYGKVKIQKEVLVGRAAEKLVEYARKNDIDLIVVATHGRSGVSRWVMGSVADRLLRSVSVPVLMVRAPGCGPKA